jgi:hypothetical protein
MLNTTHSKFTDFASLLHTSSRGFLREIGQSPRNIFCKISQCLVWDWQGRFNCYPRHFLLMGSRGCCRTDADIERMRGTRKDLVFMWAPIGYLSGTLALHLGILSLTFSPKNCKTTATRAIYERQKVARKDINMIELYTCPCWSISLAGGWHVGKQTPQLLCASGRHGLQPSDTNALTAEFLEFYCLFSMELFFRPSQLATVPSLKIPFLYQLSQLLFQLSSRTSNLATARYVYSRS